MIPSRTTRAFREAFASLRNDVSRQAQRAYRLFRRDPHHPSLRFKKVDEESNVYSVRIGLGYRALGVMEGSIVVRFWIGSHAECDPPAGVTRLACQISSRRGPRGERAICREDMLPNVRGFWVGHRDAGAHRISPCRAADAASSANEKPPTPANSEGCRTKCNQ